MGTGGGVEAVQSTAFGSHPELPLPVHQKALDGIVGQRAGLVRIMDEDLERVAVVPIQALLHSQPDEAIAVLHDGADARLRLAVFEGETHEGNVRTSLRERGCGDEEGERRES